MNHINYDSTTEKVCVTYGKTVVEVPNSYVRDPYHTIFTDIDKRLREIEKKLGIIK